MYRWLANCSMVFKVRDRLGFLPPVRSASSVSDCGDVRRNVFSSSRFLALKGHGFSRAVSRCPYGGFSH